MKKILLLISILALTSCSNQLNQSKLDYKISSIEKVNEKILLNLTLERPDKGILQPNTYMSQSSISEDLQTKSVSIIDSQNNYACDILNLPIVCEINYSESDLYLEVEFLDGTKEKVKFDFAPLNPISSEIEFLAPIKEEDDKTVLKFKNTDALSYVITLENCYQDAECFTYDYNLEQIENEWKLTAVNENMQFYTELTKSQSSFEINFQYDPLLFDKSTYKVKALLQEKTLGAINYSDYLLKDLEIL